MFGLEAMQSVNVFTRKINVCCNYYSSIKVLCWRYFVLGAFRYAVHSALFFHCFNLTYLIFCEVL